MGVKSVFAFRFSMETLVEIEQSLQLYLWTFTFAEALDVREGARRWGRFLGRTGAGSQGTLLNAFPLLSGIRVYEMHPGKRTGLSHGLHVHMVCAERLPVDIVRALWLKAGGGRLHVVKIGAGKAFYLGKYLTKGKRCGALAGFRLWSSFGLADASKCRDIVVQSNWTAAYAFLSACVHGFSEMAWPLRMRLASAFCGGLSVGDCLQRYGIEYEDSPFDEHFRSSYGEGI